MKNIKNLSIKKKSKLMYLLSFWVFILFSNTTVSAQEDENISMNSTQETFVLKGQILSKTNNNSLPGASVVLKNSDIGVATDLDGNFEMANIKAGDIISFRFLGYETQDLIIQKDHPFIKIYLSENEFELLGAANTKCIYKTKRSFWQRVAAIF